MFIVLKALLISNATLIGRAGGAIWLNPFATVLFTVCSAVTVEYCVLYHAAWFCLVCLLLCKEEGSSPVSFQLLRGGIWACMRCHCLCFVGFGDGDYVCQLPYVWHYVGVKSILNMFVRNASPRRPMCFKRLRFNLSGPCELVIFTLFYCILDLSCGECDVISLYFYMFLC